MNLYHIIVHYKLDQRTCILQYLVFGSSEEQVRETVLSVEHRRFPFRKLTVADVLLLAAAVPIPNALLPVQENGVVVASVLQKPVRFVESSVGTTRPEISKDPDEIQL